MLAPHAVKRLIEPDEVAELVSFLTRPWRPRIHRRGDTRWISAGLSR